MYYVLFVFAMLTPVLMAVVGLIWRIHPPKRDGGFLAYRTAPLQQKPRRPGPSPTGTSLSSGCASDSFSASCPQCLWLCSGRVPPPLYCG